jgi:hypothetical protein
MPVKHYRRLDTGEYVEEPIEEAARRLGPGRMIPRAPAWWLIHARKATRCTGCSEYVFANQVVAYCHEWGKVLCQLCIDREGITAKPSRKLKARTLTR